MLQGYVVWLYSIKVALILEYLDNYNIMQNTKNIMQYLQAIKSIKYMLSNTLLFTILIAFVCISEQNSAAEEIFHIY